MKQVASLISTYSSDEFGICSALFELGGMVVMHDASGCNSTYTTHDEPRWYDMDSMIFISAISEMEAIMGDDSKLIDDVVETAKKLQPAFIALVGAPIPYMIGTDFKAIAMMVEAQTGIPTFGFEANGMQDYIQGVSMAMEMLVTHFCDRDVARPALAERPMVNILGATPLDFSVNGSIESIKAWLKDGGYDVGACMCMGSSLEEIRMAGRASVNLVVSAGGLNAARQLKSLFGTPYVVGVPIGEHFSAQLMDELQRSIATGSDAIAYQNPDPQCQNKLPCKHRHIAIVGEAVQVESLAAEIECVYDTEVTVYCPLSAEDSLLKASDVANVEEDALFDMAEQVDAVIADPLYEMMFRDHCVFYAWPHEAFSGRIYDSVNPNLIGKALSR